VKGFNHHHHPTKTIYIHTSLRTKACHHIIKKKRGGLKRFLPAHKNMSQNSSGNHHVKRNNSKLGGATNNNSKMEYEDPFEFWNQNEKYFSIDSNSASELSDLAAKLIEENSLGYQSFSNVKFPSIL